MTEYGIINLDKKGAEWSVVAFLARDPSMIAIHNSGKSPYPPTGSRMFNVPEPMVLKEHSVIREETGEDRILELRATIPDLAKLSGLPRTMSIRQAAKKAALGLNYDEGPVTYALQNEIEVSEAKRHIALYHRAYPGIREVYHREVREQLERDRTIINCFGHRCYFMGAFGPDLFKQGYAYLPQSTIANMVNGGLALTINDPSLQALHLLSQVHDSGVFQYPIGNWRELARICIRVGLDYFSPEIEYHGQRFTIPTDLKIGRCWGSTMMEEVHLQRDEALLADDLAAAWERCQTKQAA